MSVRIGSGPGVVLGGVVAALWLVSGCAAPSYRRLPAPRENVTIFSPLDLPTPTERRTASGQPGPAYWQQRVDYAIDVTLDEATDMIHGQSVMTYHNNSPVELPYLWIYLEQNLFRSVSLGTQVNSDQYGLDAIGFTAREEGADLRLESVTVNGTPAAVRIYDTVARVDLPEAVAASGGTVAVHFAWSFKVLPQGAFRMGLQTVDAGKNYELAQWFPAACVFDDVHGWNTLPYLGVGEFYTNYGNYDVRITVPRAHLVAATGLLENADEVLTAAQRDRLVAAQQSAATVMIRGPEEVGDPASRPAGDGPLTWHFKAHDVRTFAWASSPAFIWDACSLARGATSPSEAEDGVALPDRVLVQSFYPAEARPMWDEATQMLAHAIEHFSAALYPYPYPSATNVNGIAGGMEYPMIIFCGDRPSPQYGQGVSQTSREDRGLYGLIAHEIGHEWFPMIVNTDERRHPWMDEGFNVFVDYYAVRDFFGSDGGYMRGGLARLIENMREEVKLPIVTYVDQGLRIEGRVNAYNKPAWGMYMLREGVLGPERFDAAFRAYIASWVFKSPRPADFFRAMENGAGQDLAWFWRGWFYETGLLDQAVAGVEEDQAHEAAKITFRNLGELVMPVVYRVTYADGSTEDHRLEVEAWFATNERSTWIRTGGRRIESIEIDPELIFADIDRGNNRWAR